MVLRCHPAPGPGYTYTRIHAPFARDYSLAQGPNTTSYCECRAPPRARGACRAALRLQQALRGLPARPPGALNIRRVLCDTSTPAAAPPPPRPAGQTTRS